MSLPLATGVRYHRDSGHMVRLELMGAVDPASIDRAIRGAAAERPSTLVLDLRRVSSVDSDTLARVLDALRGVGSDRLKVGVIPGVTTVRRVLQLRSARRKER
jgi:ABC-type transporter Mla MlaB component